MPTVFRKGPYRFFFYAGDKNEPPHIHVEHDNKIMKFWLDPVRLNMSGGFTRTEITRVYKIIIGNESEILEAWHDYFGN